MNATSAPVLVRPKVTVPQAPEHARKRFKPKLPKDKYACLS